MNLNMYSSDNEKDLRRNLERLSKDAEALKIASAKIKDQEVALKIKQKLSLIRKQMETVSGMYFAKENDNNFYNVFIQESDNERRTYRFFLISKAIKSGRRRASRGQIQQDLSESEM